MGKLEFVYDGALVTVEPPPPGTGRETRFDGEVLHLGDMAYSVSQRRLLNGLSEILDALDRAHETAYLGKANITPYYPPGWRVVVTGEPDWPTYYPTGPNDPRAEDAQRRTSAERKRDRDWVRDRNSDSDSLRNSDRDSVPDAQSRHAQDRAGARHA